MPNLIKVLRKVVAQEQSSKAVSLTLSDTLLDRLLSQYKENMQGGISSGQDPHSFDRGSILQGLGVEIEHSWDLMEALEIVFDHLAEDKTYYTKLASIEG
jgi:hypothetical protein